MEPQQTPVFRIDPTWGLPELEEARAGVQAYMTALDEDIGSIKTQLELARVRAADEGVYTDGNWYARASAALRHKGRQRQAAQNHFGDLNRRIRAERNKLVEREEGRAFVRAAKDVLSPEMYSKIWDEVRRQRMGE
jgi:hypothetical protein